MIDAQLSRYGILASQVPAVNPAAKIHFVGPSAAAWYGDFLATYGPDADGGSRVFASIATAVANANVVASRGDVILVLPGHTETVSAAGGIALSKAGVTIIGLGAGTLRPTVTYDTAATATTTVSAADVTIDNIVFTANYADIAKVFDVSTAKNFTLRNCSFKATATNMNFLAIVDTNTTDNAADGLTVDGCTWVEPDTATISMLDVDADLDGLVVRGCYLNLGVNTSDLPAIAGVATGKDLTNARIEDNDVIRLNDANPLLVVADTTTANTGVVKGNHVRHLDTAGELLVTAGTNIGFFNNYATAVIGASGYLLPAADS